MGYPSKGTPKDKRLSRNKPAPAKTQPKPATMPAKKGK
jgi:hypothetical protein